MSFGAGRAIISYKVDRKDVIPYLLPNFTAAHGDVCTNVSILGVSSYAANEAAITEGKTSLYGHDCGWGGWDCEE